MLAYFEPWAEEDVVIIDPQPAVDIVDNKLVVPATGLVTKTIKQGKPKGSMELRQQGQIKQLEDIKPRPQKVLKSSEEKISNMFERILN